MNFPDRFYFMRHGLTDANAQEITCGGEWDVDLIEQGRKQCNAVSLRVLLPDLASVFVSPMRRARQTCEIVTAGFSVPIHTVDDLREWEIGKWEGKPWSETANLLDWKHDPPGGETRDQFMGRIGQSVSTLADQRKDILIISHGAVFLALSLLLGFKAPHAENAELIYIAYNASTALWSAVTVTSPMAIEKTLIKENGT